MEKSINGLKINKYYLLGIVLFFSFMKPSFFERIGAINNIYLILQLFSIITMGIIILKKFLSRKYKPSKIAIFILLFYFTLLISTLINHQSILSWGKYSIPVILFSLIFDKLERKQMLNILNGAVLVYICLLVINFITVLLYPNGLYRGLSSGENYYFLGHNNSVIRIILPGIVFSGVYDFINYNKLKMRTYLITILTMVTVTLTWSNSAMIGCGIVLLYMVVLKNKKIDKVFNAKFAFMLICIFFIFIIILGNVNKILPSIAKVFGKDITLSGRTTIWSESLKTIKKHIIMGYGYGTSIPRIGNWEFDPSSFHNYFLDLIFRGGIVHFAIQLIIVKMCCDKISYKKSRIREFLLFILIAYFIMWQVLPFTNFDSWAMMLIFVICYQCDELENKRNM